MLDPKIVIAGKDVLAAGTVISYGWQSIDLYPVGSTPYHVRLTFTVNSLAPPSISSAQAPNSETQVTLTNFDLPGGIGTSAPIYVANYAGRKMYLSLAVWFFGAGETATRTTVFTFYQGEAVNAP
jgi:hypothetical protein